MRLYVLVASALALAIAIPAANALTVVNQDKTAYKLTVTPKGGKVQHLTLKASGSANANCKNGCDISFGDQKATYDGKTAKVMIKDGKFAAM